MCLDKILKRNVILKKDMTVIKELEESGHTFYRGFKSFKDGEKHIAKIEKISTNFFDRRKGYNSGFHCWNMKMNSFLNINRSPVLQKEFIIPKGTKILIGKQNGHTVYVTPVLINKKCDESVKGKTINWVE